MPFAIIPFLLLVIPLAEIAAFIVIGGQIGVLPTLAMVFVTAVIGSFLLRRQGLRVFRRIESEMRQGQAPARELVHGVMILAAGLLLLTPGFVTDTLGFLLFIPAIRERVFAFLSSRIKVSTSGFQPSTGPSQSRSHRGQATVIDLDESEFTHAEKRDSPWRDDK